MADRSDVAGIVEAASVPLSAAAAAAFEQDPELRDTVLSGGDDYELLFTAPAGARDAVASLASDLSLPIPAIGRILAGPGRRLYPPPTPPDS